MAPPLVSIVVPSYNQGRFIRETIDSVLSQDYRPLELIVMDGASTDETVSVLRSYGDNAELRWWSERDGGVVDAVNKGLARANGQIIAIQSSDDCYVPGAIRTIVAAFEENPAIQLIYGDMEHIDASSSLIGGRTHLPEFDLLAYLAKFSYIPQPSAFFRSEAVRAAGVWREDIGYAADAEFFLRIASRFPVRKLDAVIARYRHHDQQRDTSGAKIIRDWTVAVAPYLRHSDRAVRRHARLGILNVRYHYTPESRWLSRTLSLYRSALAQPSILRNAEMRSRKDWLPGRYPIWRLLSRIKRLIQR